MSIHKVLKWLTVVVVVLGMVVVPFYQCQFHGPSNFGSDIPLKDQLIKDFPSFPGEKDGEVEKDPPKKIENPKKRRRGRGRGIINWIFDCCLFNTSKDPRMWLYETPNDADKGIRKKDKDRYSRCLRDVPRGGLPPGVWKIYQDTKRYGRDRSYDRWRLRLKLLFPDKYRHAVFFSSDKHWKKFDEVKAKDLIAKKVVFWFTAKWCLSCKTQEPFLLSDEVKKFAEDHDIILVKVDLSRVTEEKKAELAKYNRAGIPIYVFFRESGDYKLLDWEDVSSTNDILDNMKWQNG